jgi:hypothetical protein
MTVARSRAEAGGWKIFSRRLAGVDTRNMIQLSKVP